MSKLDISKEMLDAGFGAAKVREIAKTLRRKPEDVVGDVAEAVESGCVDVESVLGYLKPGHTPPPPPVQKLPGVATPPAPPKAGFNLAGYINQLADAASASLVEAGRYSARIVDVKIGAEANDLGLRYGVFDLELIDHPEADAVPLFAAVDVADTLIGPDGLPKADMDPVARARFLSGLKVLEKLIRFTDVTSEEMADAESVDDALALFVGCVFKVAITKGTDRDGLPCNKVKSIIGAANG